MKFVLVGICRRCDGAKITQGVQIPRMKFHDRRPWLSRPLPIMRRGSNSPSWQAGYRRRPIAGRLPFHPHSPRAMEICRVLAPAVVDMGGGRQVACHLYERESGDIALAPIIDVRFEGD